MEKFKNIISNVNNGGFTLIELVVVIAIIGILTAISFISYTGFSNNAIVTSLKSDLTNASDQLVIDQAHSSSDTFPATLALANYSAGIPASANTTYQYVVNNTNTPKTFCLTATKSNQNYFITQEGKPLPGPCPVLYLDAGISTSYPGTGTTWNDLSGNGNNGALNGAIFNSINGGVMSFVGANDFVSLPYAPQYNIRNAITLAIWIKRTTVFSQTQDTMILGRPPAWYFYDSWNSGSIHGDVFIDGVRRAALDASVPFDGIWYQIIYTYDSATHMSNIYKNGASVASVTLSGLGNYLIDSSTANFMAMGANNGGRGMLLNDARILNRALSASDVSQIFNATRSRYGL